MSFTTEIKLELCRCPLSAETVLAECLGMLLFAGQFSREGLRLQSETPAVRRRARLLLEQLEVYPEENETALLVRDREDIGRIFAAYGYERESVLPLNRALVEEDAGRGAFLRGAFLIGGYVSTPEKGGYHLELVTTHYHVARQMSALLNDMELPAGQVMRRGAYVLYYKGSGAIEDFLSAAGATKAAMDLMLKKVERELRSGVNRKVNCETANLTKTVGAAARQIEAIRRLEGQGRLEQLPGPLQATARLRLDHPELSLTELCQLSPEPISRPGLNNRLRRLVRLGEEEPR